MVEHNTKNRVGACLVSIGPERKTYLLLRPRRRAEQIQQELLGLRVDKVSGDKFLLASPDLDRSKRLDAQVQGAHACGYVLAVMSCAMTIYFGLRCAMILRRDLATTM